MVPERLASVHVRDVHLDDRELAGVQGIEDRYRRMRERGRVDDDAAGPLPRFVNPVDDLVLGIALVKRDFEPELLPDTAAIGLDVREGFIAVDRGLALAEEVQVGTVQDVDDTAHWGVPVVAMLVVVMSAGSPLRARRDASPARGEENSGVLQSRGDDAWPSPQRPGCGN